MNASRKDFAERLVAEVEKRPILYYAKHPQYKDRYMVDNVWREVAEELNSNVDIVKKRWQNLRGTYSKTLGAINQPDKYSTKCKSKFYLFEQMSFLESHINTSTIDIKTEHLPEIVYSASPDTGSPSPLVAISSHSAANDSTDTTSYDGGWTRSPAPFTPRLEDSGYADLQFFKGLLPQIGELSRTNKRTFFREVSQLLFQLLDEQDQEEEVLMNAS